MRIRHTHALVGPRGDLLGEQPFLIAPHLDQSRTGSLIVRVCVSSLAREVVVGLAKLPILHPDMMGMA